MLHPLVRILLRHEISHSEFSELAKRAYVDVAYRHFSIPKRKQTYSRVSVLTGLSRKEVVRLSKLASDEPAEVKKGPLNRAVRVISGWTRDSDFLDSKGKPRELVLRGADNSFEQLVARYSGDITARAILDELLRVGAATKSDDRVRVCHQAYIPEKSQSEKIDLLSTHTADLLNTGIHNLSQENNARFQRQVSYADLPQSVIDEFQQYSHDRCLELILEFDRWLAQKKSIQNWDSNTPTGRVGVGVYYFNNRTEV